MELREELVSVKSRPGPWRSCALSVSAALHAIAAALLVSAPTFVPDALPEPRPAEKVDFWPMTRPIVPAVSPPSRPGPVGLRRKHRSARPGAPLRPPIVLSQSPPIVPVEDLRMDAFLDPPPIGDCIGNCVPGDVPGVEAPGPADSSAGAGEGRGGALRPGGNVKAPVKLRHVNPVYPEPARWAEIEGVVLIECLIDPQGRVVDARVLRGHPLLKAAALEAVRQWVYRPTLLNDVPVAVVLTVTVRFHLRR